MKVARTTLAVSGVGVALVAVTALLSAIEDTVFSFSGHAAAVASASAEEGEREREASEHGDADHDHETMSSSAEDGHAHEAVEDAHVHGFLYANHTCPTCKDPIDPHRFAEISNKKRNIFGRIYFCCADCGKQIKKDIRKYYMTLYRIDEKTGKEKPARDLKNQVCPVEGETIDGKTAIEYNGMMVSLCSADCIAAFLKDPEKGMGKILSEAKEFRFESGAEHEEHKEGHDHEHEKDQPASGAKS
jgi:YHS domain-containing protein